MGYSLTTNAGAVRARVVVATGLFQSPFVPAVATEFDAEITQLHSSQHRNPGQLANGPVLVVSGGNSGYQIAEELTGGHRVHVSISTCNAAVPQRPLGRDLFWWQTITGIIGAPPPLCGRDGCVRERARSLGSPCASSGRPV